MMIKRVSLSLLAVGMVALVVSAATSALFTANTTNVNNTFTAGTVTLDAPTSTLVNVVNVAPGDSGSGTFSVKYTGSLDAWLGLDTILSGGLIACDGGSRFRVDIADGSRSYAANGVNQLVGMAPVSTNYVTNLNINWSLDIAAGNDCQGKDAQLSLKVHAVQSRNNSQAAPGNGPVSWN